MHGDAGFTLVELLVVLALLGLLSVPLFGGLHTMARGWRQVSGRDTADLQLDAARALLRRLLSQCAPELAGGTQRPLVRFSGRPGQVAFLAPLLQRFGAEDIVAYALSFAEGGRLRLAWRLDRIGDTGAAGAEADALTEVSEGAFSFFGPSGDGGDPRWWPEWTEQRALPQLIRVQFRWHDRTEDLLVAPELTATQCAAGAAELACSE